MRMQFSAKLHAHAIVHAIFSAYNSFMMGVYQLVWTSVMMSQELMNKIQLWKPFFEGRKLGSFFLRIFRKILCIYICGLQLLNFYPTNLKKIRQKHKREYEDSLSCSGNVLTNLFMLTFHSSSNYYHFNSNQLEHLTSLNNFW